VSMVLSVLANIRLHKYCQNDCTLLVLEASLIFIHRGFSHIVPQSMSKILSLITNVRLAKYFHTLLVLCASLIFASKGLSHIVPHSMSKVLSLITNIRLTHYFQKDYTMLLLASLVFVSDDGPIYFPTLWLQLLLVYKY
jgi:hypothetical protein